MRAHLKRSLYGLRANPCGIRCWFPDMFDPIIFSRHYPEREAVLHSSVPHSSKLSTSGPEEPISTLAGGVDEFITWSARIQKIGLDAGSEEISLSWHWQVWEVFFFVEFCSLLLA